MIASLSSSMRCWFLKKKNYMIFEQFARLVCEGMIFRFPEGRQLEDKKDFYGYLFPKSHEKIMLWEWLNLSKKIVWVLSLKLGTVACLRLDRIFGRCLVMYVLHQVLVRAKYRRVLRNPSKTTQQIFSVKGGVPPLSAKLFWAQWLSVKGGGSTAQFR